MSESNAAADLLRRGLEAGLVDERSAKKARKKLEGVSSLDEFKSKVRRLVALPTAFARQVRPFALRLGC